MNLYLCAGIIISEMKFKFILQGKRFSAIKFKIRLFDTTVIDVIVYDNIADYAYRKLRKGDFVCCEAELIGDKIIINNISGTLLRRKT